jgi:hypothetical protein
MTAPAPRGEEPVAWQYRAPEWEPGEWKLCVDSVHEAKIRKFIANGSTLVMRPLYTDPPADNVRDQGEVTESALIAALGMKLWAGEWYFVPGSENEKVRASTIARAAAALAKFKEPGQ